MSKRDQFINTLDGQADASSNVAESMIRDIRVIEAKPIEIPKRETKAVHIHLLTTLTIKQELDRIKAETGTTVNQIINTLLENAIKHYNQQRRA